MLERGESSSEEKGIVNSFGKFFSVACLSVCGVFGVSDASATTFEGDTTVRDGAFATFLNTADARSFDGPGTSALDAFSGVVNPGEYLEFGAFEIAPDFVAGFEAQLLYELTAYEDQNNFGLLDSEGNFTSLIFGPDAPGVGRSVNVGSGEYQFAVQTPDGMFSSVDANNGGVPHFIGQRILQDGKVDIFGNQFDVTAGQYVLFFEDLEGVFPISDQDFNDGVVLLSATSTEIPEPATLSLLLAGLGGLKLRSRKAKA